MIRKIIDPLDKEQKTYTAKEVQKMIEIIEKKDNYIAQCLRLFWREGTSSRINDYVGKMAEPIARNIYQEGK